MKLLDTSTCIALLRGKPFSVTERFAEADPNELVLCTIVAAELLIGALKAVDPDQETAKVQTFLRGMSILDFSTAEIAAYARIRADLERKGSKIGANDLIIAATAVTHGLILVTHDLAEYSRVDGLELEDWH